MKQVLLRDGQVIVEDVPAPRLGAGSVLVRVAYSLISSGTEMSILKESRRDSLMSKVAAEPGRAWQYIRQRGVGAAIDRIVKPEPSEGTPIGYSCAGTVLEVGENRGRFQPGQLVACAGAGYANHAEVVAVPYNLVTPVPEGVDLADAASVALGAIAMNAVRRANARLGEQMGIVGLGLVGQLVVQLLKANGCLVFGTDVDPRRVAMAKSVGMDDGSAEVPGVTGALHFSQNMGTDTTIVTAATNDPSVLAAAVDMTRRGGRIVLVGNVPVELQRGALYEKELDLRMARSYGPGRYDPQYEEQGVDYPFEYVRWTENRNMASYLRLVASGAVQPSAVVETQFPIERAQEAFAALNVVEEAPVGVLIQYPVSGEVSAAPRSRVDTSSLSLPRKAGTLGVAVVGAGNIARQVHLPNIKKLQSSFRLEAVVSRTGSNARRVADRFGARYCTTDLEEVLTDSLVDVVVLCTPNVLHTPQAIQALRAGKAVLLEKPMAITWDQLGQWEELYSEFTREGRPIPLFVGFNRRFSPATEVIRQVLERRKSPAMLLYRVNAEKVSPDSWAHGPEGGGLAIGEACHMFDLFNHLLNDSPREVFAHAGPLEAEGFQPIDNFSAALQYKDGSLGTLVYTSLGSAAVGKEYLEVFCDGTYAAIDDFRSVTVRGEGVDRKEKVRSKGHREELEAAAAWFGGDEKHRMPFEELRAVTEISLRADDLLRGRLGR